MWAILTLLACNVGFQREKHVSVQLPSISFFLNSLTGFVGFVYTFVQLDPSVTDWFLYWESSHILFDLKKKNLHTPKGLTSQGEKEELDMVIGESEWTLAENSWSPCDSFAILPTSLPDFLIVLAVIPLTMHTCATIHVWALGWLLDMFWPMTCGNNVYHF